MNEEQKMYRFRKRLKELKKMGVVCENNPAYREECGLYIKTAHGSSVLFELPITGIRDMDSEKYINTVSEELSKTYIGLLRYSESTIRREILRIRIEEQNSIRDYKVLEEEAKKILCAEFKNTKAEDFK
jgi:hypothetical protein